MTTLLTDCLTGDTREDCTGDATGWRAIPRRAATHTEVVGGHSTGLARRVIGGALTPSRSRGRVAAPVTLAGSM